MLLACIQTSYAQGIKAVSVAVNNESFAFPFTSFSPIHPGVEVGMTFIENHGKNTIKNFNVNLGFYHHERLENAIYLRGEYQFRPTIKSTISIDLIGSLGYMHSFYPGEVYEINDQTGEAEKVSQVGRAHAMAGIGIGVSYIKHKVFEPFIRQEMNINSPFAYRVPVIVHSFLKLGLNIKLNNNEN